MAWHSVKDRLPKFDQVVIVCMKSGYDGSPLYAWGSRLYDPEGWCWGVGGYKWGINPKEDADRNGVEADDDYKVTHWMPLPRAPFRTPKNAQPDATDSVHT